MIVILCFKPGGVMKPAVLFVDDEPAVLRAFQELFYEEPVEVVSVSSVTEALNVLKSREIAVLVTDYVLPSFNGLELLELAKHSFPDCMRILITGYADIEIALEAINRAEIYRFVTKPWDVGELRSMVLDAVREHTLICSLRCADEAKLLSMAQMIEQKDHHAVSHCINVARYANAIASRTSFSGEDYKHLKYASWLHDCGKIGVPESILHYPGRLSEEMLLVIRRHSEWGADIARRAELPEPVVAMIRHHHEKYDGTGYPDGLAGEKIPFGARIIAIADVFDTLTVKRQYRDPLPWREAIAIIRAGSRSWFDYRLVEIFLESFENSPDGYF